MPILAAGFSNSRQIDRLRGFRAYADVQIVGTTGCSPVYQCLVDTGSDYTILPMAAAAAAGLALTGDITFRTAGGNRYALASSANIDLKVEGKVINVPVAFSTAAGFQLILGRPQVLAAFDIGFDTEQWYWG